MKAVVLQPMYLPWMGYFGMIDQADTFVFYDDVQFSRDSWQQRNKIKVPESSGGTKWLKVPVVENFGQEIQEVRINNSQDWSTEHWSLLKQAYGSDPIPFGPDEAAYFNEYRDLFNYIYTNNWDYLRELNIELIKKITDKLNLSKPEYIFSSELNTDGSGTKKLINVLDCIGADEYISGPGAKDYLDTNKMCKNNIELYWHDFTHPEYQQLYNGFISHLSIVDVMFNVGHKTTELIRRAESDALVKEND